MFDMGFTEVMLIGIVALVVIGPERLPGVAITVGKYVGRLRRFMTNVRADVESELKTDEIRKLLAAQQEELSSLKDVVSEASKGFDMADTAKSINESMSSVLEGSKTESPAEVDAIPGQDENKPVAASEENSTSASETAEIMPEQAKSKS